MTPPREGKKIFEEGNNICAEEKKNKKRKRRETFVEVKNIFAEEKKGGTHLENEKKHFFGGEGKRRRKGRKIFGEGKNVFLCGGEEELRKKIFNSAEEKKNREGE